MKTVKWMGCCIYNTFSNQDDFYDDGGIMSELFNFVDKAAKDYISNLNDEENCGKNLFVATSRGI